MRRIRGGALSADKTPTVPPAPTTLLSLLGPGDERLYEECDAAIAAMRRVAADLDVCPWWRVRRKFRLLDDLSAAIDRAFRAEFAYFASRKIPRDPTFGQA
jgi:hypothetical protein